MQPRRRRWMPIPFLHPPRCQSRFSPTSSCSWWMQECCPSTPPWQAWHRILSPTILAQRRSPCDTSSHTRAGSPTGAARTRSRRRSIRARASAIRVKGFTGYRGRWKPQQGRPSMSFPADWFSNPSGCAGPASSGAPTSTRILPWGTMAWRHRAR